MNQFLFEQAISSYQLITEKLVPLIAAWVPWLELALGVLLLIGWGIRHVQAASAALLQFFTTIMNITCFRGIGRQLRLVQLQRQAFSAASILCDSIILIPALYLAYEPLCRLKLAKTGVVKTAKADLDLKHFSTRWPLVRFGYFMIVRYQTIRKSINRHETQMHCGAH